MLHWNIYQDWINKSKIVLVSLVISFVSRSSIIDLLPSLNQLPGEEGAEAFYCNHVTIFFCHTYTNSHLCLLFLKDELYRHTARNQLTWIICFPQILTFLSSFFKAVFGNYPRPSFKVFVVVSLWFWKHGFWIENIPWILNRHLYIRSTIKAGQYVKCFLLYS